MLVWRSCFNYDFGLAKADLLVGCDDECVIALTLTAMAKMKRDFSGIFFSPLPDHI